MIKVFKDIKEISKYKELLLSLALREIKVKYKQSVLGILWAVLQPLSMMVIFTIIFSYFMKVPSEGVPYPIFSYTALLPWTFFATSLTFAVPSIVTNINLVTKIYFPREIFPIASVLAAFVNFCIAAVFFVAMLLFYRVPLTLNFFYLIPILILQVLFILGISFFASALNVYFRDIKYIIPLVVQLWMYLSPVIYPVSVVPERLKTIYMLNPMAAIIDGYRKIILQGAAPNLLYMGVASIVIITIFLAGYKFFKKIEMSFADVI
jgi:lipopolysaccharide transport system permease protein